LTSGLAVGLAVQRRVRDILGPAAGRNEPPPTQPPRPPSRPGRSDGGPAAREPARFRRRTRNPSPSCRPPFLAPAV